MSRASRRGRWRALAFGSAVAVALPIAAEGGLRLAGYAPPWDTTGVRGWTLPQHTDRVVDQPDPRTDFRIVTNADGLRTSLSRARNGAVKRVAVVGDSTVFGWGVDAEGAIPHQLEVALGEGWEVLNAGQPGYSTEQIARLVDGVVATYAPDLLVYVAPGHDVLDAARTDADILDRRVPTPVAWVRTESRLFALLKGQPTQGGAPQRPPDGPDRDDPRRVMRVPVARRGELLAQMVARMAPAPVVATVLPGEGELRQGALPRDQRAALLDQLATQAGARFVDVRGAFGGPVDVATMTLPGDPGHYSAVGAEVLARTLAVHVRQIVAP